MGDLFELIGNSKTPEQKLQSAVQTNNIGELIKLLFQGLDPDMPLNKYGHDRAIHLAATNGHLEIIEILVQANAKLDIENDNGITPLYNAYRKGHNNIVKFLLYKCRNGIRDLWQKQDFLAQFKIGDPMVKTWTIAEPCLKQSYPAAWNAAFTESLSNSQPELTELLFLIGYRAIDSDFIANQEKVNQRLAEVERSGSEHATCISKLRTLMDTICDMRRNPPSLSHICRLSIRSSFLHNCNAFYGTYQLPLPQKLKDYLLFEV